MRLRAVYANRRARISACTLKFFWEDKDKELWQRGGTVSSGLRFKVPEDGRRQLWEDRVVLDEAFWRALREHPVPLLEAAIRQLKDRSMSFGPLRVDGLALSPTRQGDADSWPALYAQFGGGFKALKHFKPSFH